VSGAGHPGATADGDLDGRPARRHRLDDAQVQQRVSGGAGLLAIERLDDRQRREQPDEQVFR